MLKHLNGPLNDSYERDIPHMLSEYMIILRGTLI